MVFIDILQTINSIFIFLLSLGRQSMHDLFPHTLESISSTLQSMHIHRDQSYVSKISTNRPSPPAAHLPRIMKIPLKDKFTFPTRFVRLEFNHSTVHYYSEIDTILLCGRIFPVESIPSSSTVCHPSLSCRLTIYILL